MKMNHLSAQKNKPKQTQFKPNLVRRRRIQKRPKSLTRKSGHTRLAGVLKIVCKNAPFGYTHPDCRATAGFAQTRAIHVAWKGFGDGGK